MPGHDDQKHAYRQNDDMAVLREKVGQVDRFEQDPAGDHLKEHHDDGQGRNWMPY